VITLIISITSQTTPLLRCMHGGSPVTLPILTFKRSMIYVHVVGVPIDKVLII
jgi:hypothetical protein